MNSFENLWSSDKFDQCLRFAAAAHAGQLIPGSELPYILHVFLVCAELATVAHSFSDPDLLMCAGALHDVLEDTPVSKTQLSEIFGCQIADAVEALSKNRSLPKSEQLSESLKRIASQSKEVWAIKLADRVVNLCPPPAFWDNVKRRNYLVQSKELHHVLGSADAKLASRLNQKITEYVNYISDGES